MPRKSFRELKPEEVLMVAIDGERVNGDRLRRFAELFADSAKDAATIFAGMAAEEDAHRKQLEEVYERRYGDLPKTVGCDDIVELIEDHDLEGAEYLVFDRMTLKAALENVLHSELRAREFYQQAVRRTDQSDLVEVYKELGELVQNHLYWIEILLDELENTTA